MDDERSQTVDRVHHLVPPRRVHTNLLKRVSHQTFEAIVRTTPDRAPDAPPLPELEDIKDDMSEGVWGAQFNLEFAIRHIATLKTIYAGHPLARPLQNSTTLCNRATRSAAPSTQKENEYAHASPASPARATQPSTAAHYRKPLVIHRRFRNRPSRSSTTALPVQSAGVVADEGAEDRCRHGAELRSPRRLERRRTQRLLGAQGSVIIAEKYREAVHFDEMLAKAAAPRCKRGSHLHSASTTSHAYAKPGRSAHREPARENNSRSLPASAFIRRPSSSSSTGPSWWTGWSPRSQWPTNTKNCWVSQRYRSDKVAPHSGSCRSNRPYAAYIVRLPRHADILSK